MKKINFILLIVLSVSLWSDFNFGKGLFNDGLYEEAINEFEKVIAYSPTSDDAKEAIFFIGESYRERDQLIKAESAYNRLLEGFPGLLFRDKVLYYLAQTQFEQQKYSNTSENLKQLIDTYPNSNFSKMALSQYLECIFTLNQFDNVIIEGKKIARNYKDYHNIPDVLLWLASARFKMQDRVEGKRILNEIIIDYPDHISRWKAVEKQIEITQNEDGTNEAAEELAAILQEKIPRNFEEKLRYKLANYYIEIKDFPKAYFELSNIINKFSSSLLLDEYILTFTSIQMELLKYTDVKSDYAKYKKVFRESNKLNSYLLQIAKANFLLKDLDSAKEWVNKISTIDEEILYRKQLLNADIIFASGKYSNAVKEYKKLLNNKFASRDRLLMKLGDIYLEKFQQSNTAKKYYQWVLTEYSVNDLQDEALYKIALCLDNLNQFAAAVTELEQIDITNIKEDELKEKVSKKLEYLKKFKKRDHEIAFNKLLSSLLNNSFQTDAAELKDDLLNILITDLKDYESAITILDETGSAEDNYKKAILYIKIAEKFKYESKDNLAHETLIKVDAIASKMDDVVWLEEIHIRKQLLLNSKVNDELIGRMISFVNENANNIAANEFRLYIGKHYASKNENGKAARYFADLVNSSTIDDAEYYSAKIGLAEHYYSKNDDTKALQYYEIADKYIKLDQPLTYFHYAVVLNEKGQKVKAKDKLAFLVNNAERFNEYSQVIKYFTKSLRESEDYASAIKYQLLLPEADRNDDIYKLIASDHEKLGNNEKAKKSLMHIVNKTEDDLTKLAHLQFTTNDLEMAKYTYGELTKKNKSVLKNFEMLGRINFIQENYLESAVNYKKVIDKLADSFSGYKNIREIAKENIIALYRIENRPKAETLAKKFKNHLNEVDKNEIEINRGIYYKKIDKKKAKSIFTKLLKKKNLSSDVMIDAYFWRGIVRLEKEELDKAEEDFSTVANSIDINMSNKAHLKLGTINFSKENFQKALSHYYKVIENDEDGKLAFDAARNFAYVCKTMKEWQKAIAAYQIILERWGDEGLEAKTVFDIAFCHFRDKKYSHAIEMFTRAIPLLEDKEAQAEAQYWIGESLFGMESYEDAVSELLKVGYNYPQFTQWAASAELKAGEAYQNSKEFDKATQIYERVISKYGKYSQWGTEASSRLLILQK
ncbi:MAG: tetratricopeptide repeat protein [Candidatus Cloacimonetes bacterium]|nr:tetratricopeptide repeat protein [Candidatus Cloacimonadota bacterium]MBT4332792.1 tetratricopeptide repeat protein [Candidatus Cloacimonadota bacterium]MBT4575068.1 tetratricopeptide repeat protein [Candidatus Cloacimonadota bacterium]